VSKAIRGWLLGVLFRYGWDTRCRHYKPARLLRDATAGAFAGAGPAVLDVGCGRAGMAAFLEDVKVMGVDLEPQQETLPNRDFTQASIVALPFADRSFPHVACIDVLQDLPEEVREQAIAELLRVARDGVVIASPQGDVAERVDIAFERALRARGAAVPPWVVTSLANPYPTVEGVVAAIRRADSGAEISVSYAEPARIARLVRAAAVRSRLLYAAANLCFGVLMRAMRAPGAAGAYRMLVIVRPSS